MPQGQGLTVVKSEPLPAGTPPPGPGALRVVTSQPLPGSRGPGAAAPPVSGRGGGAGNTRIAAATPPPTEPFYPGGWKGAAQDAAGVAGGIGATALATALLPEAAPVAGVAGVAKALPYAARVARGAIGILGAGTGGAAAAGATGSPLTAQAPPSGEEPDSVVDAFKRQAEMEAAGLGTGWVINALGRRMIGSTVGRKADQWLRGTREAHLEDAQRILDQARDAVHAHAAATSRESVARAATAAGHEADAVAAQQQAMSAEATARAAKSFGETQAGQIRQQWPTGAALLQPAHAATPPPNLPRQAATQVKAVVEGPAKRALDQIGQAVETAAESGPPVDFRPIKAQAQAMYAHTQPAAAGGAIPPDVAGYFSNVDEATIRQIFAKGGVALEEAHPLPGVLRQIQEAPDTVPFADAHRYKRMLDDAIGWRPAGAVQAPAKKQLAQITKGVRGQIRTMMASHAPYTQATQAYRDAAILYAPGGLARKIQATAEVNPEAVVNTLVKVQEPTKLQMLREVLLHHAEQGGDPERGRQAWQAVQAAVMEKHLIRPGLDKFDQSVAKMHPEFLHALTEDGPARGVFERLRQMAEAVKSIEGRTAATVDVATADARAARTRQAAAEGKASVLRQQSKQVAAQRAVEQTDLRAETTRAARNLREARKPTAAEKAFGESSLATAPPPATVGSELAYAAAAPPGSPRQLAGTARLVLRGPKVNDLIRWASLSPTGTQAFVRAVTSPAPGQAIAALIRLKDWMGGAQPPTMAVGHQQGQPAAVPPPGPR